MPIEAHSPHARTCPFVTLRLDNQDPSRQALTLVFEHVTVRVLRPSLRAESGLAHRKTSFCHGPMETESRP